MIRVWLSPVVRSVGRRKGNEKTLADDGVLVDGSAISEIRRHRFMQARILCTMKRERFFLRRDLQRRTHSERSCNTYGDTITQPDDYRVSGTLTSGQIAVDLGSSAKKDSGAVVELILDGCNITCTVAPAIIFYNVWESESTTQAGAIVTLADDSEIRSTALT